jgi:hypothetical protein
LIDRASALRILGQPEGAAKAEIRSAYWRLRAHIEERAFRSSAPAFLAAREAELRDLEEALGILLPDAGGGKGGGARSAGGMRPWVVAWALLATVAALGLAARLWTGSGEKGPRVLATGAGPGGSEGGFAVASPGQQALAAAAGPAQGEVESAGERARLVARANVPDARLEISDADEGRLVAEGLADETAYWLAPGSYALRVQHPDCADPWSKQLTVKAGENHELAPQTCRHTGWVVVRSNLNEDALLIDGREVGHTGPERHALEAGEHEIQVVKRGFEPWEGVVEVRGGKQLTLRTLLESAEREEQRSAPPQRAAAPGALDPSDPSELTRRHDAMTHYLLSRYDADRSGLLDTPEEVRSIPCEDWLGLERAVGNSTLGLSLIRMYGFHGERWMENALGVATPVREVAHQSMTGCGLR